MRLTGAAATVDRRCDTPASGQTRGVAPGRMKRRIALQSALALGLVLASVAGAAEQPPPLRVYGNTSTIELAPVLLAAQHLGPEAVVVSNGGIPNLFDASGADVATNAETQALRVSVDHPDLRIVLTVAEGFYRIVGRKSSGITKVADLRGKKIGTVPNTSAAYYLHAMLATAGLTDKDVTIVSLVPLTKVPTALSSGEVDAVTVWEPEIQNAAERLGADAVEFQDRAVYRELFNLNTTAAKLADPVKRKQIVAFVAELIKASEQIRADPRDAVPLVAKATGFDPALISKVWHHEGYWGTLVHDLADVMATEDAWLAQSTNRPARTRAQLVSLVDPTVRLEALALLKQQQAAVVHDDTLAGAQQRIEQLAVGADNVEGIRAVKRLQHAYAQYLEQGRWNDVADLFADSGVAQSGATTIAGRAKLKDYFLKEVGRGQQGLATGRLNLRMALSPVINLSEDGAHAKGRWHEVAMLGEFGKSATWEGGLYENEYVRENGVWKIATLHFYPQYAGSYEAGWRSVSETPFLVPYHYDAQGAGTPIPVAARKVAKPAPAQTLPVLAARLSVVEKRLQQLDDASDVQNLQHAYGFYVDRKLWDDVADLFTSDATMELGLRGVYSGKASIRRALDQFGTGGLKTGELNDGLQLETIVTLAPDGRTATARGVELGMTGTSGAGWWSESVYENEYAKEAGVWKIRSVHVYPRMMTDYYAGWARSALPAPGPNKDFPPDRPATKKYDMYPAVYFPPIRYPHPVKQPMRAPQAKGSSAPRTQAELLTRIAEAERNLAVAEAYDGAENVSNAYGYYIDEFKWVDTADLFARDGWKELSYIGVYVGRAHVRDSMTLRYGSRGRTGKQMTLHQKTQPVVHVAPDGQSARIRERLFQLNSVTDAAGSYIGGTYENEIVKEDGVWKISGMDLDYQWTTNYMTGWPKAKAEDAQRFAPAAGTPPLAPDRPLRGVRTAPFPNIVDVPFHYLNPVSGRAPAVLLLP